MGNDDVRKKDYASTCRYLKDIGLVGEDEALRMPASMPRYDDEKPLGISFFRTELIGVQLEDLTMPRTFFGRSEIRSVSFRRSDLPESCMCWNDFIDVDFSGADLSRCDMRASAFDRVNFSGANLEQADLRHATFHECSFRDANMQGVNITEIAAKRLQISQEQMGLITLQLSDGPEPDGG